MASTDGIWRIKYEDQTYELSARDLTVSRLRQMKSWFGREYGAYLPFIQLLIQGDADAVACALWLVKKKAGEPVREPRELDFAVADMFSVEEVPVEDDEADPTPEAREDTPTLA